MTDGDGAAAGVASSQAGDLLLATMSSAIFFLVAR
jgi:hypothetical protein